MKIHNHFDLLVSSEVKKECEFQLTVRIHRLKPSSGISFGWGYRFLVFVPPVGFQRITSLALVNSVFLLSKYMPRWLCWPRYYHCFSGIGGVYYRSVNPAGLRVIRLKTKHAVITRHSIITLNVNTRKPTPVTIFPKAEKYFKMLTYLQAAIY